MTHAAPRAKWMTPFRPTLAPRKSKSTAIHGGGVMSTVAHPEAGIEQLLHAEQELLPPKSLVENARLKDYAGEYRRSVEDPEGFWSNAAKELEWFQPWNKVFEWKYPTFEWFRGGKCNITYNCLDRQVKSGRKNKVAYIWAGEDGTEQQITYGQLLDFVSRTANGLKSLGVKKGDRVIIYMPLCLEGVVSMLACARIGAETTPSRHKGI